MQVAGLSRPTLDFKIVLMTIPAVLSGKGVSWSSQAHVDGPSVSLSASSSTVT